MDNNKHTESKMDKLLEEIVNNLGFMYVSDIRVDINREKAIQYIKEQNILEKDKELYYQIMGYIKI